MPGLRAGRLALTIWRRDAVFENPFSTFVRMHDQRTFDALPRTHAASATRDMALGRPTCMPGVLLLYTAAATALTWWLGFRWMRRRLMRRARGGVSRRPGRPRCTGSDRLGRC